jgi:sugar phosphate isomerase/epimerase
MQKLGTKLIRIMSYAQLKDRQPDDQLEEERFRRLRAIRSMFDDAGIIPVHENCMNYGGLSFQHTLRMIEKVPGLRLVFDTGNPVFLDDHSKEKPYPKQSSWEFYSNVKSHISYVHIKDCVWNEGKQHADYTYPGEGDCDVKKIVTDLLASGYDGGISIEPHLAKVFHDKSVTASEEQMMTTYVEYGKRLEAMVKEIIS